MKILKEGTKHIARVWHTTCSTCGSVLEFVNGLDPSCNEEVCYNCDANQYYSRYICPVCGAHKVAFTSSCFEKNGNATYEERVVRKSDYECEAPSFTKEDVDWIKNRNRYWSKDAE